MDFSTQSSGICTFCFIIWFYSALSRGDSSLSCLSLIIAGLVPLSWSMHRKTKSEFLQHKRVCPAPQSLQTCIWLHSGSTDLAQTANKSQPSQLHSFKSHYCSHSWLNSSAFISNEKKKEVQAALNNFQIFPVPSEHVSTVVRLLSAAPLKWWWFFFFWQDKVSLINASTIFPWSFKRNFPYVLTCRIGKSEQ